MEEFYEEEGISEEEVEAEADEFLASPEGEKFLREWEGEERVRENMVLERAKEKIREKLGVKKEGEEGEEGEEEKTSVEKDVAKKVANIMESRGVSGVEAFEIYLAEEITAKEREALRPQIEEIGKIVEKLRATKEGTAKSSELKEKLVGEWLK